MTTSFFSTLLLLLIGHVIADFFLQSRKLSWKKRRTNEPKNWWKFLLAHSSIHGFFVSLFTGSLILGIGEFLAHAVIDFAKCERLYGFYVDQLFHITCKIIWIVLLMQYMSP